MNLVLHRLFWFLVFVGVHSSIFSQFNYRIETNPDSAAIYINGELKGYSPYTIQFYWREVPDSGFHFSIEKNGYLNETFELSNQPDKWRITHFVDLLRKPLKILPDSNSIHISSFKGESILKDTSKIGHIIRGSNRPEILEWGQIAENEIPGYDFRTNRYLSLAGLQDSIITGNQQHKGKIKNLFLNSALKEVQIKGLAKSIYAPVDFEIDAIFEFKLYTNKLDTAVFSYEVRGNDNVITKQKPTTSLLKGTYEDALITFLNQPELKDFLLLESQPNLPQKVSNAIKTSLKKVVPIVYNSQPEMIQNSLSGCVTVLTEMGHGSGVIISENGIVMTAFHVIEDARNIEVILSTGIRLKCEVIKIDKELDIAIIDITGSGFSPLPICTGSPISVGSEAYTIGTPADIDLGQSVSKGIISGKRKFNDHIYIQTDLAVSPGNSGGPLLNDKGEVIGIIQAKLVGNGVEGINITLPIEEGLKRLNIAIE